MRVLAIDPGFDRMGIAILEGDPSRPSLIASDCFMPEKGALELRLGRVHAEAVRCIKQYTPDALALETLFFSTNVKTAIAVAEARGTVLAAAGLASLPVIECSPQHVKLAVAGHGGADKASIARMVPKLIALPPKKRLDDELDAIALGIAALATGIRPR